MPGIGWHKRKPNAALVLHNEAELVLLNVKLVFLSLTLVLLSVKLVLLNVMPVLLNLTLVLLSVMPVLLSVKLVLLSVKLVLLSLTLVILNLTLVLLSVKLVLLSLTLVILSEAKDLVFLVFVSLRSNALIYFTGGLPRSLALPRKDELGCHPDALKGTGRSEGSYFRYIRFFTAFRMTANGHRKSSVAIPKGYFVSPPAHRQIAAVAGAPSQRRIRRPREPAKRCPNLFHR